MQTIDGTRAASLLSIAGDASIGAKGARVDRHLNGMPQVEELVPGLGARPLRQHNITGRIIALATASCSRTEPLRRSSPAT